MDANQYQDDHEEDIAELELYEVGEDEQEKPVAQAAPAKTAKPSKPAKAPRPPGRKASPQSSGGQQPAAAGEVDENGHRVVLIDGERFTVVEGDLVLDIDQKGLWQDALNLRQAELQARARMQETGFTEAALNEFGGVSSSLVGIVQDGKLVRWAPGTVLSYCVLRNTFPREEWYEEVVANMQEATAAWEQICGVSFEYAADLDTSTSVRPQGVLFPVRYISAGGAFIAAAFFPNDPPARRRVLIDASYFTTSFDHVGVLRHELGHVIGFRHEHIRSGAPQRCPHEDLTGTQDLTQYDPRSVMHYFCGGVGTRDLQITEVDRIGAQKLYGPPLTDFELLQA